jgi:rubredoxin-NAD+ reductase
MNSRVWECITCGFIYDESKGLPSDGIPAGTAWEEISDDWLCPDCGLGKAAFTMKEKQAPNAQPLPSVDHTLTPVIVIGSGHAGYQFARDFRTKDVTTPLILLTGDDGRYYQKPKLSVGIAQNLSADQLVTASAESMAHELSIDVQIFCPVTDIDPVAQTVTADGKLLSYQSLVLATGSESISASLTGDAVNRVVNINNLTDYAKLRVSLNRGQRVLIMGGGLIGCELANTLSLSGAQVTMVEPQSRLMASLLPKEASLALQQAFEQAGIQPKFDCVAQRVEHHTNGVKVTLSDNSTVVVDVVVCAIGVTPNVQLAKHCGLTVDKGIVVDSNLRTSSEHVYALGDCAQFSGRVFNYLAPLVKASQVLANNLAGCEPQSFELQPWPIKVKTSLCPVKIIPALSSSEAAWQVQAEGMNVVARYLDSSGNELGAVYMGAAVENPTLFDGFTVRPEYRVTSLEQVREIIGQPIDFMLDHKLDYLDSFSKEFVEQSPLVWVSTTDANHHCDGSPKGGEPGFVKVMNERTLIIPDSVGNKLAYGFGNICQTGTIGLTIVIPNTNECLRINGRAEISCDPQLLAQFEGTGKPPQLCTIVSVEECFFHCGKAFIRSGLWRPDSWPEKANDAYTRQLANDFSTSTQDIDALLTEDYRDNI